MCWCEGEVQGGGLEGVGKCGRRCGRVCWGVRLVWG